MSFPDVVRILANHISTTLGICEAGVMIEEGATFPFLLMSRLGGERDANNVFATDVIDCQLYVNLDIDGPRSPRQVAYDTYEAIDDSISGREIWTPMGMIDTCEIQLSASETDLPIERDNYVLPFQILTECRAL